MPIHRDAIKKTRQDLRKRERNRILLSAVKTAAKKVSKAIGEKNQALAQSALRDLTSILDSAASKGVIHHNTAGRKISRMTIKTNQLSSKS